LTLRPQRLCRVACLVVALTLAALAPTPARADFFDDLRRTFQSDIPHFFQDDIPCAFGGQPTSHTKASCNAPSRPAKQSGKHRTDTAPPAEKPKDAGEAPPASGQ
jgi:hypothetical protein